VPDEFEVIHHPQISTLNLFLITVKYRTPHLHRDFELDFILDGEARIQSQGRDYAVKPGQLCIFNPNCPHELLRHKGNATILCLQIPQDFFKDYFPGSEGIQFDFTMPDDMNRSLVQKKLLPEAIDLAIHYFTRAEHYKLHCAGLLHLLLYHLVSSTPFHPITADELLTSKRRAKRLNRILEYADQNYMYKIRLSDLAKQEKLSLGYLSHFVKDNINQTFQEYIDGLRYNQARKLLSTGEKSILDVCIESGFSDPRYLSRAFLHREKMTPDEFRRKNLGNEPPPTDEAGPSDQTYYNDEDSLHRFQHYRKILCGETGENSL